MKLLEKIFSIKKENTHNVCIILGVKLKFKRKNIMYSPSYCDIYNYDKLIQLGVKFPHPYGIVISRAATIGNNCIIYQNVTIGAKTYKEGNFDPNNYPKLGNNVVIYAGAVVCGNIKIGNNAVIGANSVVLADVPDNCTVAGIPAKIVKSPKTLAGVERVTSLTAYRLQFMCLLA